MTKLLEQAFNEAAKLPETDQDALAKQLLEELRSEAKWAHTFAASQDILAKLADDALHARKTGQTKPLDHTRL